MNYKAYLESDHWKEFRRSYLKHHGINGCEFCGKNGVLHLHHKTYVRIYREEASDVVAICKSCHNAVHEFCETHPKITLEFATREVGFRIANNISLAPVRTTALRKPKRRKKRRRLRRRGLQMLKPEVIEDSYIARDIDVQFQFVTAGI